MPKLLQSDSVQTASSTASSTAAVELETMGNTRRTGSPTYGAFETDDRLDGNDESERLLFVEPRELTENDPIFGEVISSSSSASTDVQEGVRKIEAISRTWTQKSLVIAYLG